MDFKRKVSNKEQSELQRTLKGVEQKHKKSIFLVSGIGALLLVAGIWFNTEIMSDPDVANITVLDSSPWVTKHVAVNADSAEAFLEGSTQKAENTNKPNGSSMAEGMGTLGGMDINYFFLFPVYEATVAQINGDYNDDGKLDGSKSDGGLGPIGETHSELPNTIEAMYDADPVEFEYLKPFADNPMLYMKTCNGNDRRNHTWPGDNGGCRTYWEGSLKVREAVMGAVWGNPTRMKRYYDEYLRANVEVYINPARNKLQEITGKPADELGYGTVGTLFAVYVRYGQKEKWTNGCTASMTEDELIAQINRNAYAKGGEKRFICSTELAQRMNRGEIDIYGYYKCAGACGESHGVPAGRSYGDLFTYGGK